MHGALRVNLRCAAIRAVHDPLLEYAPHDKEGAHRQYHVGLGDKPMCDRSRTFRRFRPTHHKLAVLK